MIQGTTGLTQIAFCSACNLKTKKLKTEYVF